MARRLMFVQLKSGHGTDRGPSWIAWVDFNKTWKTARVHGRELRRFRGIDANFYDVETDEWFLALGTQARPYCHAVRARVAARRRRRSRGIRSVSGRSAAARP